MKNKRFDEFVALQLIIVTLKPLFPLVAVLPLLVIKKYNYVVKSNVEKTIDLRIVSY